MRLHRIAERHVSLSHHPVSRWVLLAMAGAITAVVVWKAYELRLPSAPILAAALGTVLLLGAGAVAQARRELEIGPEAVRWSTRGAFAFRSCEWVARREEVDAVVLRARVERSASAYGGGPAAVFEVEIAGHPPLPETIPLYRHRLEERARAFARELCAAADLPLLDAIGELPERREPAELIGPPPRRAPRPPLPPPRGLVVEPDPVFGEVLTTASWWGGRARIWIIDGELHVARGWFAVPGRHRRVPVESVERVRVESRSGASEHLREGVAVVGSCGVLRFGGDLGAEARAWLRAWLESRLWPTTPADVCVRGAPVEPGTKPAELATP